MKQIIYYVALSSSILFTACANDSNTTDLEGTWKRCENGELSTLIYTNSAYESITDNYSNSDCTGTLTANTIDYKGQFSIGREFITPSDLPAKELDLVEDNGDLYYDIFRIEVTSSVTVANFGYLYDGTHDGRTPATRPIKLDIGEAYIKQN